MKKSNSPHFTYKEILCLSLFVVFILLLCFYKTTTKKNEFKTLILTILDSQITAKEALEITKSKTDSKEKINEYFLLAIKNINTEIKKHCSEGYTAFEYETTLLAENREDVLFITEMLVKYYRLLGYKTRIVKYDYDYKNVFIYISWSK